MSETTRKPASTIVIVLAVAVVVLAAGLGFLIWQNAANDPLNNIDASSGTGQTGGTGATGQGTSGAAPGAPGAAPATFDPATATKVPGDMTPEELVKAYHEDVVAGKFAEAYAMLPLDKQQSYGDAASYEAQVKAYGITGYEMGKPVQNGDELSVAATQVTPQMPITYTWTFVKVDGVWYVKSRDMGGSTN